MFLHRLNCSIFVTHSLPIPAFENGFSHRKKVKLIVGTWSRNLRIFILVRLRRGFSRFPQLPFAHLVVKTIQVCTAGIANVKHWL